MPGPPQPVHSLLYRWPDTAKYYWEQWEGAGVPGDVRRAAVKMKSGLAEVGSARPTSARPLLIFTSARPTLARPLLILTSARPTFARPRLIFTGARPTSPSQPHSLLPGKFQAWNVDVQRCTGQG